MKDSIVYLLVAISASDAGIPKATLDSAQLQNIVTGISSIAAAIAVIFIVVSGIKYSISQGDPGKIKQAKEQIIYSIVGLVIVIFAFVIVRFAVGQVFK